VGRAELFAEASWLAWKSPSDWLYLLVLGSKHLKAGDLAI